MRGNVKIEADLKMGMIKIGKYSVGTLDMKYERTIWENNGTVIFRGKTNIGSGVKLSVGRKAILIFGSKFCITGRSSIICNKEISFGNECLLSWDILMMDTDFHDILNKDGEIVNSPKQIKIGDRVWIGCRNTILKGVNICNDVVVAAGSKIIKDITTANCIVGGTDNQRVLKRNVYWKV